jgi:hypothetical protein
MGGCGAVGSGVWCDRGEEEEEGDKVEPLPHPSFLKGVPYHKSSLKLSL